MTKKNSLLGIIETALGAKLTRHQRRMLDAVLQHRRVAVASCHAIGKSYFLACLAIAWAAAYPDARVLIIVPGWLMARSVIFSEIHALLDRAKHKLPVVSSTQTQIQLGPKNFIMGLSTSDAQRLQGHHSEHLLVIVDEAAAIDADFWPAIESTLAGGDSRLIIAGNPTTTTGPFHDAFGRARASWHCIQIGAFDTDNFQGLNLEGLLALPDEELDHNEREYLITKRWAAERYREWWNGAISNSPLWASRVLGIFPTEGSNSLFPLAALEAARRPAQDNGGDSVIVGVDVAGAGRDRTVCVAVASGAIIDLMVTTDNDARGPVLAFLRKHADRLSTVRIDSIGLGYYFAEHVRGAGYRVEPINVSRAAEEPERFTNLKAQRYWHLRQRFIAGNISGLSDAMFEELAPIAYVIDPKGRTAIEDKASVRSTLGRSPDLAESLMLAAGDYESHVDHDFQRFATAGLHAMAELRRAGPTCDGPQTLGGAAIPQGTARLWAKGEDVSRAEDRAESAARRRWGAWWIY